MADDYIISARIVAEDETGGGAVAAEKRLDAVERKGATVGASLGRMFAALAGAAGIGRLTRGVVGLHSELQEAEAGMATLLAAQTGVGINQALGTAKTLMGGLTRDAAQGAGEFRNYFQGLQTMLGPGLGLGATIEQLQELNRNALGAGFAMRGQEGLSLASFDVAQALTGQVGERTTPIVMQALRASGQTAEAFRRLAPEQRVEALNRAFQAFAPGVELMGRSWSAQTSTLFDHLRRLARIVTRPLFERWSEQLQRANGFLSDNQDTLESLANQWGPRLLEVWDGLIERARLYAAITAGAAVTQVVGGGTVVGAPGRARGGLMRLIGGTRSAYAAGGGGMFAGFLSMARAGLAPLARIAGRAAAPLAVLTVLITSLVGGAQEYAGAAQWALESGQMLWGSIVQLGDSFALMSGQGSALNLVGAGVLLLLGGMARGLNLVVMAGTGVVLVLGFLVRYLGVVARVFGRILAAPFSGESVKGIVDDENRTLRPAFQEMMDGLKAIGERRGLKGSGADEEAPDALGVPPASEAPASKRVTNINGPINVEVRAERLDDPTRVSMTFESVLSRLRAHPRAARRNPLAPA